MTLIEAQFKIRHDCPFVDITRRYPDTKMFVWCNREKEVVEVIAGSDSMFEQLKDECYRLGTIVESVSDSKKIILMAGSITLS